MDHNQDWSTWDLDQYRPHALDRRLNMHKHVIVGGKELEIGMRVFTYDWEWGTVLDTTRNRYELEHTPHEPESEHTDTCRGWFDVRLDDKPDRPLIVRSYDCTRMATAKPKG